MVTARMDDERSVIIPTEELDELERDTIPGPPPDECEEREVPSSKRTDPQHETMPAPSSSSRKKSGTYRSNRVMASTIAPPLGEDVEVHIPRLRTPKISVR